MNMFSDFYMETCIRRFYKTDHIDFHPRANSIEFIRNGQCYLLHNNRTISLKAPVLFWLKRGETYSFIFDRKLQFCEHIYFDCNGSKTDEMIEYLNSLSPQGTAVPNEPEKISELFFEQLKLFRLDPRYYEAELYRNFITLAAEIVRALREKTSQDNDPYKVIQLANDMRKDPFQKYNIPLLAKKQGITSQHFRRLFRQEHKLSPAQYQKNQKMTIASELLSMTDMRVKEVAFNCHYDSLMDFSRSFKKFSGLSPMEYRKRHREETHLSREELPGKNQ